MKTQYCSGRSKLPAPTINLPAGIIQSVGSCYFWLKARNRAGYNIASDSTNVTITNNKTVQLPSVNFNTYAYEDWQEIIVCFNTNDDFTTSRVVYKQKLYESDQITPITLATVNINSDYVFNGSYELANLAALPTVSGLSNGYRVYITNINKVYEYQQTTDIAPDGVTVIEKTNGYWLLVPSNSLTENTSDYRKELFEVNSDFVINAPLAAVNQPQTEIKYSILNDTGVSQSNLQLQLNNYCSDSSLDLGFTVTLLGYFNYLSESLDTTNIDYVNVPVDYTEINIKLNKPLPNNSALVFKVLPSINSIDVIPEGVFVTIYPKLSSFIVLDKVYYWGDPVETISDLRALPSTLIIDNQVRRVISTDGYYSYDTESTDDDDGSSVIKPNFNPLAGRWLINASNIPEGSITPSKLSSGTLALINGGIETNTVTLDSSVNYTINLDVVTTDYLILTTPVDDNGTTVFNITATLTNNSSKSIVVELRQRSGDIEFNSSISFPGGSLPQLSGNNKTDLFVFLINKDSTGLLKKRGYLVQKDIG